MDQVINCEMWVSVGAGVGEFLNDRHLWHGGAPSTDVGEGISVTNNTVVRFSKSVDFLAACIETDKLMGEIIGLATGITEISNLEAIS